MAEADNRYLVTTEWLEQHLEAPDLVVLDASWHLPTEGRNARAEYLAAHIPGAIFFDIDDIADTDAGLPHMLPSPAKFSSRMRKLGVGDGARIVVYDAKGIYSAPRVWWMFRVMGKEDVAVLDGGLPKWRREERPLEDGEPPRRSERHFTVRRRADLVRDKDDVKAIAESGRETILDARSPGRYAGTEPEPRAGLRAGHIPGARNLPFSALVAPDGTLKPGDDVRAALAAAGVAADQPLVASCGSGITAAVIALALAAREGRDIPIYDGSWTEWGSDRTLPITTGATP